MTLIQNAQGIFTALPGDAMRANGAIRIADGRIAAIGALERQDGEEVIDASGCVIYPGLVSTHHHLFQSVLKGVRAGIDVPLLQWLRAVPFSYWHKIDEANVARLVSNGDYRIVYDAAGIVILKENRPP